MAIANSSYEITDNCTLCIARTELFHLAAVSQPVETVTNLLIRACNQFNFEIFAATCKAEYSGIGGLGLYYAQLFAKMSQATGDMTAFCYYNFGPAYHSDQRISVVHSETFGYGCSTPFGKDHQRFASVGLAYRSSV